MQNNTARRASIALGVFMTIVLIAGAILPLLGQNTTSVATLPPPTPAPTATLPPPITDFSNITFEKAYLHPTGLFAVSQPQGWVASNPTQTASQAQVNFINNAALSVIDVYVEKPAVAPVLSEELSARFTEDVLDASWANFSNWSETNRRMDGDRLLIDFAIALQGQQYVARQIVTTDGEWIYVTRVLAPNNATGVITYLMENMPTTFVPFKQFDNTPFDWQSYFDHQDNHAIRFPQSWTVGDSAPGRLASISGINGERLRVQGFDGVSVEDEAAARAWVESERAGATVLSVEPTTRGELNGFSVAYAFADADGEPQSGLAVLLNGADGVLHTANLYFTANNVDLNTVATLQEEAATAAANPDIAEPTAEATGEVADLFGGLDGIIPVETETGDQTERNYVNYATVMSTFSLIPVLDWSTDSLPLATPTPLPTPLPVEATAEATAEAELTEEASATEEASEEATAEATAEATDAS